MTLFARLCCSLVLLLTLLFCECVVGDDEDVAGNDQVADIIKNYTGRGALSDGSEPTPPEESLKGFRMREGFEIELVASEPIIGQPLHISWDSQGRMWVTQYLQYQFPAGLKIVEYDNHLRAQFDKVPEPPPHGVKGADKITVFEDTDGDGTYDTHRDVITGLNIATSCVTGAGGIWVSNPPYLLFYPDADQDTIPDGDPEVRLSGFGIEDTHAVMNSLKWGPDGWLYGANGSTTTGAVENPATGKIVEWQGQMIWRYHPTLRYFEIYAEGGGNTFSVEIDSAGRVFSGTNNGKTRGMYYPQGSYGKKSWGKHGPLTNPYAFGYFNHMAHEGDDRRFAQAFCIYEGGLFPNSWEGKIIAANSLHNIVWVSDLQPDGSTFKTVDEEPLVETDDRWFRPVFCGVGPDGCVYLADWYDTRLSHVRPVDDWHKTSGRIYRIKPEGSEPKWSPSSRKNWTVRKRKELDKLWRSSYGAISDPKQKVPILTSLALSWPDGELLENLNFSADEYDSTSGRARLASAAKRAKSETGLEVIQKLLTYEEDIDDPHIPLLIWWAIEEHAEKGQTQLETMAADPETWESRIFREVIAERLMRRYAMAGGEANFMTAARLLQTAPDKEAKKTLMTGLQLAFQGAPIPELPEVLSREMDAFAAEAGENGLLLGVQRGDREALQNALKVVASNDSDPVERLKLAAAFGTVGDPVVVPVLLRILALDQQSTLKRVALQSLANYEDPNIPKTILARHGSTLPAEHEVRSTAHRVLAGRVDWAKQFLEKVELAHIKARNVSTDVVQLLAQHKDPEINAAIRKFWPDQMPGTSAANEVEIARIEKAIAPGGGDPESGEIHFATRCANCHRLFGKGTEIGPDLTGYERHNPDFWIPAIVDPSLELREGYLSYVVSMKDGRKLMGMVKEQSPQNVKLRDLAGQESVIDRDAMESLEASPISLMPPGLLGGLSDEELRDLFAYLMKPE